MTDWTEKQIMAARAIALIKRKLEPKCEACGVGADRPKCYNDLGGYCQRHEQDDYNAYHSVIESLTNAAFTGDARYRWAIDMPIYLYNDFSEEEIALLRDLADAPNQELKTRKIDERFASLRRKGACSLSAQYDFYWTRLEKKGRELLTYVDENNLKSCSG